MCLLVNGPGDAASSNLAALLLDHPFVDEQALLHGSGHMLTAGAARARAHAVAADLRAAGVEAGHGVGLRMANGPEHVVAMMAIWLAGAVLIPINDKLPAAGLAALLDATGPAVLVEADGIRVMGSSRVFDPGVAFVMWTSGTDRDAQGDSAHPQRLFRAARSGPGAPTAARSGAHGTRHPPISSPSRLALNAGIYNALFGLKRRAAGDHGPIHDNRVRSPGPGA